MGSKGPQAGAENRGMGRAFLLRDETRIKAPLKRCFLLSTSLAIVEQELGMKPVRGKTAGLVAGGDRVRWEGWQLGLPQFHESLIEPYRPYTFFRDRMIAGRFAHFEHDHNFTEEGGGTVLLWDELRFAMPWGWVGELIGRTVMVPHIRGLLKNRFARLKRIAESEEWKLYLGSESGG